MTLPDSHRETVAPVTPSLEAIQSWRSPSSRTAAAKGVVTGPGISLGDWYHTSIARATTLTSKLDSVVATSQTALPPSFRRELRRLMAERGVTFRALATLTRETDPRGKGLTHAYINALVRGQDEPSAEALELLARALDIDPADWLEYRLAVARRLFDEANLERAAQNLAILEAALGRPVTAAAPHEEFAQALEDAAPAPGPEPVAPGRAGRASESQAGAPPTSGSRPA